ncbi:hypothetical protein Pst134EB_029642 [Puccinia striiformis f. sp. tritici]|uniref:Uncharacterized protein n=1 Tax=Puccinia striiformis TaxID=27350 RepID=A0A2S4VTS0_9BASI|nr:hypothetical protein Pst134EB_029642 [Puccinia striiformis f. sp. tritici]POW12943.1 hypothetical protein PSTT_04181 [Puccinia striiformis]
MVVNRCLDRSLFNEPDCISRYIDPFGPVLEQRIRASGLDPSSLKPFDLPIVLLPPNVDEPDLGAHPPAHEPENLGDHPVPIPLDSKDHTNYLGVKLFYSLFPDNV